LERCAAGLLKTDFGSNSTIKELGTMALAPGLLTLARYFPSRIVVESPETDRAKAAVANKALIFPILRVYPKINKKI
jgi:hypothetical protein